MKCSSLRIIKWTKSEISYHDAFQLGIYEWKHLIHSKPSVIVIRSDFHYYIISFLKMHRKHFKKYFEIIIVYYNLVA